MNELLNLTIPEIAQEIKKKKLTPSDILGAVTKQIKIHEPTIHSYITLCINEVRKEASSLRNIEPRSLLYGIPISVKDSLTTEGIRTTVGSKILENFIPPYDATSYARLKASSTILIGKTNLDEFAHGFTTEYSAFGPTHNPWNPLLAPGGSSGGAAASVATREALLALATENFGSIIQPASLCGVVGMKPTYGRSSRYGIIAMVSSLECPGIIGRCVEDVAIGIDTISGYDEHDATSVKQPAPQFYDHLSTNIKKLRLAVIAPILRELDTKVADTIPPFIKTVQSLGITVNDIGWYDLDIDSTIYDILYRSEVASNLARYDGIRYGHRTTGAKTLDDFYFGNRDAFGEHVKRQITTDPITLSEGKDTIYLDALKMRRINRDYIDDLFKTYDAIVTPATAFLELQLGSIHDQSWRDSHRDMAPITSAMLCPSVLYGYPAISFPIGFTQTGMPIGINLFAKRFNEQVLFNIAYTFQKETALKCLEPELHPYP